MRPLSPSDCLEVWERGSRLHPLDRALMALGAALPGAPREGLADWPLGRRNRALAELRCSCFGPDLRGWLPCSRCAEKLEFAMDGRVLIGGQVDGGPGAPGTIVARGHSFRLPTSRDLARVAREADARSAALRLLDGCRLGPGAPPDWSDEDLEEVGERMAEADPMAEIRVTLHCPACDHDSEETLDIASFLWSEIEGRAKRLLFEIHTLASAYGWTEREILSLSDSRRASYVEMIQS